MVSDKMLHEEGTIHTTCKQRIYFKVEARFQRLEQSGYVNLAYNIQ